MDNERLVLTRHGQIDRDDGTATRYMGVCPKASYQASRKGVMYAALLSSSSLGLSQLRRRLSRYFEFHIGDSNTLLTMAAALDPIALVKSHHDRVTTLIDCTNTNKLNT